VSENKRIVVQSYTIVGINKVEDIRKNPSKYGVPFSVPNIDDLWMKHAPYHAGLAYY
jgi:hypothetical protein